ncbi:hypothetical protein B0H19DRAFT_1145671 [Mycena capillaripes]|nr:hypothetical protein B0H19DRAFT_1145671 [Mycena capillaripes]
MDNLLLDELLTFKTANQKNTLRLRALIYHSAMNRHFTSIVLDKTGMMWYHDGISTGRSCTQLVNIKEVTNLKALYRFNEQRLSAAIYA